MSQRWANLRQDLMSAQVLAVFIPVFMVQKGSLAPRHGARMEMEQNCASYQEGFCPGRGRGTQGLPSSQMTVLGMGHGRPPSTDSLSTSQEATVATSVPGQFDF